MNPSKLKVKKVGGFFKKLPRTLGEKSLLTFFILLTFAIIIGCLIFYKYSPATKFGGGGEPEAPKTLLEFQEKTYEEVLKVWQEKEKKFEETDLKLYPDPFR